MKMWWPWEWKPNNRYHNEDPIQQQSILNEDNQQSTLKEEIQSSVSQTYTQLIWSASQRIANEFSITDREEFVRSLLHSSVKELSKTVPGGGILYSSIVKSRKVAKSPESESTLCKAQIMKLEEQIKETAAILALMELQQRNQTNSKRKINEFIMGRKPLIVEVDDENVEKEDILLPFLCP